MEAILYRPYLLTPLLEENEYTFTVYPKKYAHVFLLCCALLLLYIDWFSHIHQAYFTGTVAI